MIYIDHPPQTNRYGKTCHLLTDGDTEELVAFAKAIGLKREWIQYEGTFKEHFDVMNSKIDLAIEKGAIVIYRRELTRILRNKLKNKQQVD